jgi:hypothetical protein
LFREAYPAIQSPFSGVITTPATPAFQARASDAAHRLSAARTMKEIAAQSNEQRECFMEIRK